MAKRSRGDPLSGARRPDPCQLQVLVDAVPNGPGCHAAAATAVSRAEEQRLARLRPGASMEILLKREPDITGEFHGCVFGQPSLPLHREHPDPAGLCEVAEVEADDLRIRQCAAEHEPDDSRVTSPAFILPAEQLQK